MQFIEGKNRTQSILFPESLDQIVSTDNEVRVIDLFVESINLTDFKFAIKTTKEGRPAYHPKDLLKLSLVWLSQSYPLQPPLRERMQKEH